jgi:hypothetical protein
LKILRRNLGKIEIYLLGDPAASSAIAQHINRAGNAGAHNPQHCRPRPPHSRRGVRAARPNVRSLDAGVKENALGREGVCLDAKLATECSIEFRLLTRRSQHAESAPSLHRVSPGGIRKLAAYRVRTAILGLQGVDSTRPRASGFGCYAPCRPAPPDAWPIFDFHLLKIVIVEFEIEFAIAAAIANEAARNRNLGSDNAQEGIEVAIRFALSIYSNCWMLIL